MPVDQGIDYIELPGADLGSAQSFYSAVFGWSFEDFGPDYTSFSDGRLAGGFYRSGSRASVASGSALVVIYATDLESTLARVTEHGGTVIRDIFSFPGGRRFHFADPNGNELAVWSDHQ
jgi:uncharacterized protein